MSRESEKPEMTNQKELQRETELLAVLVPIERIIAHEIALIASRNSSIRMLVRQYSPKRWFVRCCILWGYGVLSGFFTAWQLGDALETEQIQEALGRRIRGRSRFLGAALHMEQLAPYQLVQDGSHRFAA